MNNYFYGGQSSTAPGKETNEDFMSVTELDDTTLLAIIADGHGTSNTAKQPVAVSSTQVAEIARMVLEHDPDLATSNEELFLNNIRRTAEQVMEEQNGGVLLPFQPAALVSNEISETVRRVFLADNTLLSENPEIFLRMALMSANRVLGAFMKGNETLYSGLGASVTCVILWEDGTFSFAHTGETALSMIRMEQDGYLLSRQLSKEHTLARRLYDDGVIDAYQFARHPDRLTPVSELGRFAEPMIQTFTGELPQNAFLVLTTKGVHLALDPQQLTEFIALSERCEDAAESIIKAAKMQKYHELGDQSVFIIWRNE